MKPERDLAPAVTRAIQILDLLARSPQPLKPIELALALQLPKSSVHGVCSSLIAGGLVERTDGGEYRLGLHLVDLAQARLSQNDLAREFTRLWARYPEFAHEAVLLSELDGTDVVYLACRNSVHPLGVTFRVGLRLPAALTASGKALLSTLDEAELKQRYGRKSVFEPLTPRSVRSMAALRIQLDETRERGYSIDNGETREGMYSIGAAILNRAGTRAVAGIALCFFRSELRARQQQQAVAVLKEVAAELSRNAAGLETTPGLQTKR